ncbi:MAG TPA: carboxymuconolactone decarboxylase family protein, partial [Acidimicrobiales bacterium]|nr:carboxymuconolactone decarboxylase family protein [Acidimicrobiales bacterium]
AGFGQLHAAAVADGALTAKVKELMALAIAVVKQCDGCIAYHAKAAARAGATPGEVAELLGVALLMDGGTASVYAPRAWEAYNEFQVSTTGDSWRDVPPAVVEVAHDLGDGREVVEEASGRNGDQGPAAE